MPYNYILSEQSLRSCGLDLENKIVIFDEAHNAPQTAESAFTKEVSLLQLNTVDKLLTNLKINLCN
jgi:Rad3-related DNA helicase